MIKIDKLFCWLIAVGLCSCSLTPYENNPDQTIQQPSEIQGYFTPGIDCEKHIVEKIKQSKKMDMAIYSITSPAITDAIIAAHNNGAAIRIVTDRTQAKGKKSSIPKLRAAGIPVRTNKKTKIEHNKFTVFDDVYVEAGSWNYTVNGSSYNSENCIFFDQPGMKYSERFEYLWRLYDQ